MQSQNLPKPLLAAINRNAFRIAKTEAYPAIRRDLEQRAWHLMSQPHATTLEVIALLDGNHYMQTSAKELLSTSIKGDPR